MRPCLEGLSRGSQRASTRRHAQSGSLRCDRVVMNVTLSARLRQPRLLDVHPAEAWSQPVVARWDCPQSLRLQIFVLAAVAALRGAWWSVGTLNPVKRVLIDGSVCLVEPCALSMPAHVQQQAQWSRVLGHRSQLPVVTACA